MRQLQETYPPIGKTKLSVQPGKELLTGLFVFGWTLQLCMFFEISAQGPLSDYGFGMGLLEPVRQGLQGFESLQSIIIELCVYGTSGWSISDFASSFAMWMSMVLAMMLPLAFRIFDNPEDKVVSLHSTAIFLSGFMLPWIAFCASAMLFQWGLHMHGILNEQMVVQGVLPIVSFVVTAILIKALLFKVFGGHVKFYHPQNLRFKAGVNFGFTSMIQCMPYMLLMYVFGLMNILGMIMLMGLMYLEITFSGKTHKSC